MNLYKQSLLMMKRGNNSAAAKDVNVFKANSLLQIRLDHELVERLEKDDTLAIFERVRRMLLDNEKNLSLITEPVRLQAKTDFITRQKIFGKLERELQKSMVKVTTREKLQKQMQQFHEYKLK